jgi:hypothetical protein
VLRLTALDGRATARAAGASATALAPAPTYARYAPERTLMYALVQAHYPDFIARLAEEDRSLPETVREEFDSMEPLFPVFEAKVDEVAFLTYFVGAWVSFFLSLAIYDWRMHRRVHAVTAVVFIWFLLGWLASALT